VFSALPESSIGDVSANMINLMQQCSLAESSAGNFSLDNSADASIFEAVAQLTNMASGKQFFKYIQSILNFPGFSSALSDFAQTIPNRPSSLTGKDGKAKVQFEISAGSTGHYAVLFISGSAVGVFKDLLYFENLVTDVYVSDYSGLKPSAVTLLEKSVVYLPSFEKRTRVVARLKTQIDGRIPNPTHKL
jgi:hypothetical protein